jgi:hypothetical protein
VVASLIGKRPSQPGRKPACLIRGFSAQSLHPHAFDSKVMKLSFYCLEQLNGLCRRVRLGVKYNDPAGIDAYHLKQIRAYGESA